ncbi:MAG: outer membrane beta-barrel protein [Ginsengibacter sp.]
MNRIITSLLILLSLSASVKAQTVSGTLRDNSDQSAISNATLQLLKRDSSITSYKTVSDKNGAFIFKNVNEGKYILSVTSVGYSNLKKGISVSGDLSDLGSINITKTAETLTEVVINSAPTVRQKNDTTEFSASQFKVNPDATGEDLIKKLPGVTVDKQGSVTAQGESVKKVTVDGRDFFGDDATATLRNLPSTIIDKIQVFDKLSDQAQLTGFDDGNTTKSINIVTKKDMRQGNFGRVFAGYGTDDRYSAGGNVSFFNNNRRISVVGLLNNVNQQNFSSQDLLGVQGSGNRGGGGRRGGGGGNDLMVGAQSGIARTNAIGINYSDAWGKKIDVSGSYFFNNSKTSNNQTINRQNFISKDTTLFYDENSIYGNTNYNNRVNFRLDYKLDSNNSILFTTGLNFQKNDAINFVNGKNFYQDTSLISSTVYDLNSNNQGYNYNNNILFRHAFTKRGRSISLNVGNTMSNRNGNNLLVSDNIYYDTNTSDSVQQLSNNKTKSNNWNFNVVYTEPMGKKGQLQLNYNPSFQKNTADQETYNFVNATSKYSQFDTSLSNVFDNTYNTQRAGLTYRMGDRNNMISAGISFQNSELKSDQVFPQMNQIDNSYNNFLANAMARLKLSTKSNLRVFYRSSVSPPSINQLQNVINISNQLYYTTGNPDLKQQYSNNLVARYNYTNTGKATSFFANVFLSSINNYVSNATYTAKQDSTLSNTIILHRGSQLSKPVNLDGYISARSFFTLGMPLKFIKSNINFNGGISYSKLPGLLNGQSNISKNLNYNIGSVLSSNISEYIDFNISYSANINNVNNSLRPTLNNNYITQSAGLTANLLTKKGSFFQNDISNEKYSGLSDGFNQSYWLWNMAVGQKFLKGQKGELKLSVFDLLNQNKSISRDVTEAYVQDTRNDVLQQYFMLTFTYKLQTFGKGKANPEKKQDFRRGGFYDGAPPPPPGL